MKLQALLTLLVVAPAGLSAAPVARLELPTGGGVVTPEAVDDWDARVNAAVRDHVRTLLEAEEAHPPRTSLAPREAATPAHSAAHLPARLYASPTAATRRRAVELCAPANTPACVTLLLGALEDPDDGVRTAAARALEGTDTRTLFERVLLLLGAPGKGGGIARVLPVFRERLTEPMVALLRDTDAAARQRALAAHALGAMGAHEAGDLLVTMAGEAGGDLGWACASALLSLRAQDHLEAWLDLSWHEDQRVRRLAINALGVLGGDEALMRLHEVAVGDGLNGPWLQGEALRYIGEQPAGTAVPMLVAAMEQNAQMRARIAQRLEALTGMPLGPRPDLWRQWLENPAAFMPREEDDERDNAAGS